VVDQIPRCGEYKPPGHGTVATATLVPQSPAARWIVDPALALAKSDWTLPVLDTRICDFSLRSKNVEEQSAAVQWVLPLSIALIMLSMGLGLVRDDFKRIFDKPRAVFVGLCGQLVLLPLLGFAVAFGFGLPPELAVGIIVLTAGPGGAHSNLYASLARGDVALSVTLTAVSGMLTVLTIPPLIKLATLVFASGGEVIDLPMLDTMANIFLMMVMPVGIGMWLRSLSAHWAARLERLVKTLAVTMLLLIVVGSVASQSENVLGFVALAGLPVLTLNLLAMLMGYYLARNAQLPASQCRSITLEVGIQNSALAFALSAGLLESINIAIPAILYSMLVYFTGLIVIVRGRLEPAASTVPAMPC
jgi:BASS family bile acid:Na+ symporter